MIITHRNPRPFFSFAAAPVKTVITLKNSQPLFSFSAAPIKTVIAIKNPVPKNDLSPQITIQLRVEKSEG